MVNLIQIDKSGGDILEKDYSIGLVLNRKYAYGVNIPQTIRDRIIYEFNKGNLWKKRLDNKKYRMRLKVRFHTAVVIILLKRCMSDFNITKDVFLEICNDYDGHFHEIKDMIYKHISPILPTIKFEDIVQVRFQKPSLIDNIAMKLRHKKIGEIDNYKNFKLEEEEVLIILRK